MVPQKMSAAGLAVRVADVVVSYGDRRGVRPVLSGLSLDIQPGSFVSILGRSGVGKSTLLRAISGLLPVDSGSVTVGDVSAEAARMRKTVGFMAQTPALLPWRTVRQNVELVQRVNRRAQQRVVDVSGVIAEVGLGECAGAYPHQLSGGMQHRVSLARALAAEAPLLALDEPFASLDEVTRNALQDLVVRVGRDRGCTIVMVTHNLDDAVLLSDRVVVLGGAPATVLADVHVAGEHPRRAALDSGVYATQLSALRRALEVGE